MFLTSHVSANWTALVCTAQLQDLTPVMLCFKATSIRTEPCILLWQLYSAATASKFTFLAPEETAIYLEYVTNILQHKKAVPNS